MLSLHTHPYTHGHIFEKVVTTQSGALIKLTFVVVLKNGEHKAKLISVSQLSDQRKISGARNSRTPSESTLYIAGKKEDVIHTESVVSPYLSRLHNKVSNFILGQRPRAPSFI